MKSCNSDADIKIAVEIPDLFRVVKSHKKFKTLKHIFLSKQHADSQHTSDGANYISNLCPEITSR